MNIVVPKLESFQLKEEKKNQENKPIIILYSKNLVIEDYEHFKRMNLKYLEYDESFFIVSLDKLLEEFHFDLLLLDIRKPIQLKFFNQNAEFHKSFNNVVYCSFYENDHIESIVDDTDNIINELPTSPIPSKFKKELNLKVQKEFSECLSVVHFLSHFFDNLKK